MRSAWVHGVFGLMVLSLLGWDARAAQRTFVSAVGGHDANPCSRAMPCRSFGAAIALTDAGGEVVALDSGGYGPVTIDSSVALIAPSGVHAAITALTDQDAIAILAGSADVIVIRGLVLNSLGGTTGVLFQNGGMLHVERCVMSGFSSAGLYATAPDSQVFVNDTISRNNTFGFAFGTSTQIRANLDSVRAEESFHGILADGNSVVTVTRSVASGSTLAGFIVGSQIGVLNLQSCTASMNQYGVYSNGTLRVYDSTIVANDVGVTALAPGVAVSFGNNRVDGNGSDGTFTSTVTQQ